MNKTELESKVTELKEELFNLRFQLATGQLQNTTVIQNTKRDIARCLTVLRQMEQNDAQYGPKPKRRRQPLQCLNREDIARSARVLL